MVVLFADTGIEPGLVLWRFGVVRQLELCPALAAPRISSLGQSLRIEDELVEAPSPELDHRGLWHAMPQQHAAQ